MRLLLLLSLLGAACAGPPAPDACLLAGGSAIDTVEIGEPGDDAAFTPMGTVAHPIRGPQGGTMIALRIRVAGANPPSCLQQATTVAQSASQVSGMLATPLATYPDAPGTRVTRTLYVILSGPPAPGPATIEVSCGDKRATLTVDVEP